MMANRQRSSSARRDDSAPTQSRSFNRKNPPCPPPLPPLLLLFFSLSFSSLFFSSRWTQRTGIKTAFFQVHCFVTQFSVLDARMKEKYHCVPQKKVVGYVACQSSWNIDVTCRSSSTLHFTGWIAPQLPRIISNFPQQQFERSTIDNFSPANRVQ